MSFHRTFRPDSTNSEMRVAVERRQGTRASRTVVWSVAVGLCGEGPNQTDFRTLRPELRWNPRDEI